MIRHFASRVDVLRNNVKLTELVFSSAPSIYASASAELKMSFSGKFRYNPLVDYLNDEIQPVVILDGIEHKLGIFRFSTISSDYDEYGCQWDTIEAYDRGLKLKQAKVEDMLHFDAGEKYTNIITQLLIDAGITNIIQTDSTATLPVDREDWEIGTEYITIINQLLSEINYNSIWFNADGNAILQPYAAPTAENIQHIYDATTPLSVIKRDCGVEFDIYDKPNVFIAIVSNPDFDQPLIAKAENNNPESALSIIRRGLRIPEKINVDNIASAEELQAYVDMVCNKSMLASQEVDFSTAIMPGHGIGDIIAINHPDISGIFEETAWQIVLQAGRYMTHKAKKVVII